MVDSMAAFFKGQMDYIFFFYGLAFLIMAAACFSMRETRESDIVSRYGGEEFLLILPETGLNDACKAAERVRKAFEEMGKITVSLGVSSFHAGVERNDELIKEADDALYRAKEGGRNRVEA